jgi:hypothetical protein
MQLFFLQIFRGNFFALECEIFFDEKLVIAKLRSQPREAHAVTRPTWIPLEAMAEKLARTRNATSFCY